MSSRLPRLALLAASVLALGCASGPAWMRPAPSSAQAAEPAPEGLQERVERMEVELAELRKERGEPAEEAAAAPAPPEPEKKREALVFYVTPDITFKPGLRLQTRYQYDTRTNNNELYIARFRLKAGGQAYEIASYYLEMKIDNTGKTNANPTAAVENGWLDFTYDADLIGRAGLYDVPFSRDALTSDSKLLLIDRSLIKDALTSFGFADNGIGVMARGRPFGGRFEYMVGGFNNDKFNGLPGSSARNTGSLMPMARLAVDLLDPAPLGGYADYRGSYVGKGERLTIGLNGGWLGDARATASDPNFFQYQQRFDVFAWGVDLFFNKGPWTLQGEYDWFRQTGNVGRSNRGWYVQGGYLVEPLNRWIHERAGWFPEVELAARYQYLNANSFRRDRERQTTVGMNYYIRDHNLKVQTDYSFRNIQDTEDRGLYQIQLQLDF